MKANGQYLKALMAASLLALAAPADEAAFRFINAPLTRSEQNESNAAMDRACAWLVAQQQADGSWCGDARITAVTVLALEGATGTPPPQAADAIARAASFLQSQLEQYGPSGQTSNRTSTWCAFALASLGHSPVSGLPPLPPPPATDASQAERSFWFAHAINTLFAGIPPLPDGASTNWQEPLASQWTVSQQIDSHGRGHWQNSVEVTAFAVLLLSEL